MNLYLKPSQIHIYLVIYKIILLLFINKLIYLKLFIVLLSLGAQLFIIQTGNVPYRKSCNVANIFG